MHRIFIFINFAEKNRHTNQIIQGKINHVEHASLVKELSTFCLPAVFTISLAITGVLIPKILLIAYRKKLFDTPDERKIHSSCVPRLGGIAFVPAIIISIGIMYGLSLRGIADIGPIVESSVPFSVCGLLLLYLTGISDDLIGVRYRAKFVMQIISALLMIGSGLYLWNLQGFMGIYEWWAPMGYALTALVVVFVVNSINLIDGIDGLASGLSAVACATYGVVFAISGHVFYSLLAFAALGTLVPFFYYNVFGNPAMGRKIFMGDTGSLCIGFILAYLAVAMSGMEISSDLGDVNPIVVGFAPLLLSCLDVLRVFIHRLRFHRSPFLPDCSHIHHKLLALGLPTPVAMIAIISASLLLTVANIMLSAYVDVALLLTSDVVLWIGLNVWLTQRVLKVQNIQSLPENGSFL